MSLIYPFGTDFGGTRSAYARPIRAAVFFLHRLTGVHELRKRVRPYPGGGFPLRFSEELRSAERESLPRPRWGKRKDNLRFSFLFELLPFPC